MDKLKQWLYKTFTQKYFAQDIKNAQERGYKYGVNDIEEKYDVYAYRHYDVDANYVIRHSIDEKGHKIVLLGKSPITDNEITELKAEANFLRSSRLYKVLMETVRQLAIEKAVMNSKDFDEVISGKSMILNLSTIKNIIELIEKL